MLVCVFRRIEKWRVALRREDLMKVPTEKLRTRVVCSDHFEDSAYMCPKRRYLDSRLTPKAVPTLFSHKNAPKVPVSRKPPAQHQIIAAIGKHESSVDEPSSSVSASKTSPGRPLKSINKSLLQKIKRLQADLRSRANSMGMAQESWSDTRSAFY